MVDTTHLSNSQFIIQSFDIYSRHLFWAFSRVGVTRRNGTERKHTHKYSNRLHAHICTYYQYFHKRKISTISWRCYPYPIHCSKLERLYSFPDQGTLLRGWHCRIWTGFLCQSDSTVSFWLNGTSWKSNLLWKCSFWFTIRRNLKWLDKLVFLFFDSNRWAQYVMMCSIFVCVCLFGIILKMGPHVGASTCNSVQKGKRSRQDQRTLSQSKSA